MSNHQQQTPHELVKPGTLWSRFSFKMGVGLMLFLVLVIFASYYVAESRGREVIGEQTRKLNNEIGQSIILKLRERLAFAESLTTSLANLAVKLPKDEAEFHRLIPHMMAQAGMEKLIAGGGIWPEPEAFEEGVMRRSFFWGRNAAGELAYYDDYNDPEGQGYHQEEWYVPARYLQEGEVYWSKSYMDPYSMEPMVTCTVPMWEDGFFRGVATIDLRLEGLSEFMRDQARVIGGYAFALDRNQRLISFPSVDDSGETFRALVSHDRSAFPTMTELSQYYAGFEGLLGVLQRMNQRAVHRVQNVGSEGMISLARAIAQDSYQIELAEATTIAANLRGRKHLETQPAQLSVEEDPLLSEPSLFNVIAMPDTGWRVVIAMPARYAESALSQMTRRMIGLLLVLITLVSILFALFFNTAFLMPISRLTSQVRRLVSRQDYRTKLDTNYSDELAQLANWFNIRSSQLAEALDTLQSRNRELEDARQEAEQANRSKNIFLASMSHEIRTPMNAVLGMAEILERTELKPEQSNYLHTISSSAQALLSLINDIMDFSKIEANQLDLEYIPFDLRTSLDDCAELIAFQAAEKKLDFIYYLDPAVKRKLIGDAGRLRQVLLNLASNAVKFTSTGYVQLWVEEVDRDATHTTLSIQVNDTGIGISEEAKAHIFNPFIQGDSSTTRKFGGTGLGLAISKHLVELMGGQIDFDSEEGRGTRFHIQLKFAALDDHLSEASDEQTEAAPVSALLILGESALQTSIVSNYGRALGWHCQVVTNLQSWQKAYFQLRENYASEHITSFFCDERMLDRLANMSAELNSEFARVLDKDEELKALVLCQADASGKLGRESAWRSPNGPVSISRVLAPLKFDELRRLLLDESALPTSILQPVRELVEHDKHDQQGQDLEDLRQCKILVAEDNQINQQVILLLLQNLGLDADVASDGFEAVEAACRQHYDLILMDWQMPRLDGLEASREIRKRLNGRGPVIIAVTANAMSGDLDACIEAGMDDYISKPVRREKLKAMLRHWLS